MDHIIIGDNRFTSLVEDGLLMKMRELHRLIMYFVYNTYEVLSLEEK